MTTDGPRSGVLPFDGDEPRNLYIRRDADSVWFIHGDLGPHCSRCGDVSDAQCDYPVGDGKTCDAELCDAHAREVAPDVHYCPGHLAEWEAFRDAGGVREVLANVVPYAKSPARRPK